MFVCGSQCFVCVCVCVCVGVSVMMSKVGELYHPIWPEFDPRKDVADGRKERFNMFVQGQLRSLTGVVHASLHAPFWPRHTLFMTYTHAHTFTAPYCSLLSLDQSFCDFSMLLFRHENNLSLPCSSPCTVCLLFFNLHSGHVRGLPLLWSTSVYL